MVDKGQLGIGYLIGVGGGLIVSSFGHLILIDNSLMVHWIATIVISWLGIAIVFIGLWIRQSDLSKDHGWNVAIWCAIGLIIPTVIGVVILLLRAHPPHQSLLQMILIILISSGGIVGLLVGSIIQLNKEHRSSRNLAQRTSVLNRVLRHNVRNEMNLILGYASRLESGDATVEDVASKIQHTGKRIVNLSYTVRQMAEITDRSLKAVDIVPVIDDAIERLQPDYPDASIACDCPASAWVVGDSMLQVVIDNILENAIRHNKNRQPEVQVSVRKVSSSTEFIEVEVADNGPGIPEHEQAVLDQELETAMEHGSGLGLWLLKWYIEAGDGEFEIRSNQPRGSIVSLRLPPGSPPASTKTESNS